MPTDFSKADNENLLSSEREGAGTNCVITIQYPYSPVKRYYYLTLQGCALSPGVPADTEFILIGSRAQPNDYMPFRSHGDVNFNSTVNRLCKQYKHGNRGLGG